MTKPRLGSKPVAVKTSRIPLVQREVVARKLSQMLILTSGDFLNSFRNVKVPYTRIIWSIAAYFAKRGENRA